MRRKEILPFSSRGDLEEIAVKMSPKFPKGPGL